MDFPFDVSDIFPYPISTIDGRLHFKSSDNLQNGTTSKNERRLDERIVQIINELGAASAKAQGLHTPITSTTKVQDSEHRLYIMKDPDKTGDHCVIVGMIKVGRKQLYLLDETRSYWKVKPLCVLDFYIHESKQRMGFGHSLFEHMLQAENAKPFHLAIDRPSKKCVAFLEKHYRLTQTIPQGNKFVIYQGFFSQFSENDQEEYVKCSNMDDNVEPESPSACKTKDINQDTTFVYSLCNSKATNSDGGGAKPIRTNHKEMYRAEDKDCWQHFDSCTSWTVMGIPPPSYMQARARDASEQRTCYKKNFVHRLW